MRIDIFSELSNQPLTIQIYDPYADNQETQDQHGIDLIELKGRNDKTNDEVILINNEIIDINRATLYNNNLPINQTTCTCNSSSFNPIDWN